MKKAKTASVVSVNISVKKGIPKTPVEEITLIKNMGVKGDAHQGSTRQVSLLSMKSIKKMRALGLEVNPGDFAENITLSEDIKPEDFKIGQRLITNRGVILEITQIGKKCHTACNITRITGKCVMPREGIFAKVIKGGIIKPGDSVTLREH